MADEINKETPEVDTLDTSKEVEKKEEKLLTQEQFDKALKERLERDRAKLLKETEKKIKEVQAEAERLAKLSADEKEKELTEKKSKEISNREKEIAMRENRLDAIELFTTSKVPTDLVTYVIEEDKDKTLENAENFITAFNKSVAQSVADQLKGNPPKDISVNSEKQPRKVATSF